eukprot:Nk52_evm42s2039 gene=Nk52_evmTU42s2039
MVMSTRTKSGAGKQTKKKVSTTTSSVSSKTKTGARKNAAKPKKKVLKKDPQTEGLVVVKSKSLERWKVMPESSRSYFMGLVDRAIASALNGSKVKEDKRLSIQQTFHVIRTRVASKLHNTKAPQQVFDYKNLPGIERNLEENLLIGSAELKGLEKELENQRKALEEEEVALDEYLKLIQQNFESTIEEQENNLHALLKKYKEESNPSDSLLDFDSISSSKMYSHSDDMVLVGIRKELSDGLHLSEGPLLQRYLGAVQSLADAIRDE